MAVKQTARRGKYGKGQGQLQGEWKVRGQAQGQLQGQAAFGEWLLCFFGGGLRALVVTKKYAL